MHLQAPKTHRHPNVMSGVQTPQYIFDRAHVYRILKLYRKQVSDKQQQIVGGGVCPSTQK